MNATTTSNTDIVIDGLWRNNAGVVQLLGLCPLLAVSTTLINGLALGIATTAVLIVSNLMASLARRKLVREIRLLFYVLVIAAAVSAVDQFMAAHFFRLYLTLGIFVPLIAANCLILARAEVFASQHAVGAALLDGLATGTGFTVALLAIGALREAIGRGTLLADAQFLFGASASGWTVQFSDGFLLAILPPGAFFTLAFVIAAVRALRNRRPRAVAAVA